MSSPLLNLPGAVAANFPDNDVAAHYGSIANEQKRFESGEAFVDLSNREVIAISGADRLSWLHSLTTQHFLKLASNESTSALILSPQGRVEHAFAGFDDGETFWAHTEPGRGDALANYLDSMRFTMRVEVRDANAEKAVIGLVGLKYQLVDRTELSSLVNESMQASGIWAWEAFRIAAGQPRFGLDTDGKTIPNEINLLNTAVHMDKGCYRGQETVARVFNLGRPPRRLVLLYLDGSVDRLPEHCAAVEFAGDRVGFVGSAARHYELGPIALAIVKRNVPTGETLLVDGIAANQEVIVDPEVGLHVRPQL